MGRSDDTTGYVYLVLAVGANRVKIGHTFNLWKRMQDLKTSSSHPLRLIGAIENDGPLERELHRKFAKHRVTGEWFYARAEILAYFGDRDPTLRFGIDV